MESLIWFEESEWLLKPRGREASSPQTTKPKTTVGITMSEVTILRGRRPKRLREHRVKFNIRTRRTRGRSVWNGLKPRAEGRSGGDHHLAEGSLTLQLLTYHERLSLTGDTVYTGVVNPVPHLSVLQPLGGSQHTLLQQLVVCRLSLPAVALGTHVLLTSLTF